MYTCLLIPKYSKPAHLSFHNEENYPNNEPYLVEVKISTQTQLGIVYNGYLNQNSVFPGAGFVLYKPSMHGACV